MQARLKGDEMFLFTPRRCRTWRMGLCSVGRVVASSMAWGWCPALPAEKTCNLESFWGALGREHRVTAFPLHLAKKEGRCPLRDTFLYSEIQSNSNHPISPQFTKAGGLGPGNNPQSCSFFLTDWPSIS